MLIYKYTPQIYKTALDTCMTYMYCVLVYRKHYFASWKQNQYGATSNLLTSNVDKHRSVGMAKYKVLFCTLLIDLFLTIAKEVTCIWV